MVGPGQEDPLYWSPGLALGEGPGQSVQIIEYIYCYLQNDKVLFCEIQKSIYVLIPRKLFVNTGW